MRAHTVSGGQKLGQSWRKVGTKLAKCWRKVGAMLAPPRAHVWRRNCQTSRGSLSLAPTLLHHALLIRQYPILLGNLGAFLSARLVCGPCVSAMSEK